MTPVTSLTAVSAVLLVVSVLERVPGLQFAPRGLAHPFLATDGAWYLVATGANLITTFVFQPVLARLAIPGVSESVASLPVVPRLVLGLAVYDAVRGVFAKEGVADDFPHHAGHGLGLTHPEAPFFVRHADETLLEGDVVTLEPGLYVPGVGGIRIENNYLVTKAGYEKMSHYTIALRSH